MKTLDYRAKNWISTCGKISAAAAENYPQKLPQRGCDTQKKRGTGFPVPLKTCWNYSVPLTWSTAPAGPWRPCRASLRHDTGFQIHNILYLFATNCYNIMKSESIFPRFSHQNFACGKVWEIYYLTALFTDSHTSVSSNLMCDCQENEVQLWEIRKRYQRLTGSSTLTYFARKYLWDNAERFLSDRELRVYTIKEKRKKTVGK